MTTTTLTDSMTPATRIFDRAAAVVTLPLRRWVPRALLPHLLFGSLLTMLLMDVAIWTVSGRGFFAFVLNPLWWAALVLYVLLKPVLHEFAHVAVARAFGYRADRVGVDFSYGLNYRPYARIAGLPRGRDAAACIWIPLAGIYGDVVLIVGAGLVFVMADAGTVAHSLSGTLNLLLHWNALVHASLQPETDGRRTFDAIGRLPTGRAVGWRTVYRVTYWLFVLGVAGMLLAALVEVARS